VGAKLIVADFNGLDRMKDLMVDRADIGGLIIDINNQKCVILQSILNSGSCCKCRFICSIENSDVCILMLDATRGIEGQDLNIFSLVQRNQKGLVVVVNKWDLIEDKTAKVMKGYEDAIRDRLAPFTDFPIVFTSALTKQRILKVLELAKEVYQARTTRIPTARLNEELLPLIEAYPPPSNKGKYIKIKYITQLPNTQVPSFVFFANLPQYVKEPYRRFLENKIRERWKLSGTPINIFIRQK
jgi:GTP-binding protein